MRLVTLINNHQTSQLYQDRLNSLDCEPIAENLIYNVQLQLRNADFKISVLSADDQRLTTNYVLFPK